MVNEMLTLRVAGIIVGLFILFFVWILNSRNERLSNFDRILASLIGIALILLGVFPNMFNSFLELFSFQKGGGNRILGLLVFSNFIVYFLLFISLSRNRNNEQLLDKLVRELAKKEFRKEFDDKNQEASPIYIVIPAYNEAENIAEVLKRIPDSVFGLKTKTLVVVDGATDNTEKTVKDLNMAAISYTINRGEGSALKAGYQIAFEDGADIVVTLDADGQHDPEEIPKLVKPILDDKADLVNGSRVLGHYEKDSQFRAIGVILFNWVITILTMTRITDSSNSFRALRVSEYPKLDLQQIQFQSSELLIDALKKRLRVIEVPITIKKRMSGESKKGTSLKYALGFTRAIILTWLR